VLDGRRPWLQVRVAALVEVHLGMPAYVRLSTLDGLLRERPKSQYLHLRTDPTGEPELFRSLKKSPHVAVVSLKRAGIEAFNETVAHHIGIFITMFSGFACLLGFGVSYNAARISLSERGRELATLRVLGFTAGEIGYILLAELAVLVVLALPLGCLAGVGLINSIARAFDTELFRMPAVIDASSFGYAMLITLAATAAAGLIVRRRIAALNLINVLKTRE